MKTYTSGRFKQIEKLISKLRRLQFEGHKEEDYHNLLIKVRRFKKYILTIESNSFNRNVNKTLDHLM